MQCSDVIDSFNCDQVRVSLAVILVLGVKEHTDTLVPSIHVEFQAPWRPHNLYMTPRREYAISDSGPHSGVWRSVEGVIRVGTPVRLGRHWHPRTPIVVRL